MMDDDRVIEGSGNVYADFGHPDADERLNKAHLAMKINRVIAERGLTQTAAAELLGIDQPNVSRIARGVLRGFSSDRLAHFLNLLGYDVNVYVQKAPADRPIGHTTFFTHDEARATAPARRGSVQAS